MKKIWDTIVNYLKSVQGEMKRITWPTKQELRASTIVVIITLIIITSFLWLSNKLLVTIFQRIHLFLKG